MQSIESVLINETEDKLKHTGLPNVHSDIEEEKSRSGSQGNLKVVVKKISSRSIFM